MESALAATLREIARQANVSVPAVSQAVNGTGRLRDETRQRILSVARDLGYLRNRAAVATRTQRFSSVGLLLPQADRGGFMPDELLRGVQLALTQHALGLTVARLPDEKLTRDGYIPHILTEWSVDGLLINYTTGIPRRMLTLIRQHHVPSVWINTRQPSDCVRPDDQQAASIAMEHLLNLGHRRIAFVNYGAKGHYSSNDREQAYRQAMKAAGLTDRIISRNLRVATQEQREAFTASWIDVPSAERPTAVLAYSDFEALSVFASASRLGIRLPEDLSLVCHAAHSFTAETLGLTRVELPEHEMGRQAVAMLLQRIEQPRRELPARALPSTLKVGRTTAPAASLYP